MDHVAACGGPASAAGTATVAVMGDAATTVLTPTGRNEGLDGADRSNEKRSSKEGIAAIAVESDGFSVAAGADRGSNVLSRLAGRTGGACERFSCRAAVPWLSSHGWIVPKTERPGLSARAPACAGSLPCIIQAHRLKITVSAASIAATDATLARTKSPVPPLFRHAACPGTPRPQSVVIEYANLAKIGALWREIIVLMTAPADRL